MTNAKGPTRPGLTLLETLVVVAIISALAGALVPVLGSSREAARAMVCASNLRQLQAVNADYARDHRGRFVAAAPEFRGANLRRWHGARESSGEAFRASGSPLAPYLIDDHLSQTLRECPTFAPSRESLEFSNDGFERAAGGYGYNSAFVGVVRKSGPANGWFVETDLVGSRVARFAQPSGTVGFTDAAFAGRYGLIEYSFAEPNFWPDYSAFRTDPSIHFRHTHGANVAWLDGHVGREVMTRSAPGYATRLDHRTLGLGWFGTADDNRLFDYD